MFYIILFAWQNAAEIEKVEMTKNMLLLQGSNKELVAKVESLNKTIEANNKTKKELQVGKRIIFLAFSIDNDWFLYWVTLPFVGVFQIILTRLRILCTKWSN